MDWTRTRDIMPVWSQNDWEFQFIFGIGGSIPTGIQDQFIRRNPSPIQRIWSRIANNIGRWPRIAVSYFLEKVRITLLHSNGSHTFPTCSGSADSDASSATSVCI